MSEPFALASTRLIGIGDLAELAGVSHRALRYYEAEGLIQARRDPQNARFYDSRNRERVLLLARLRRAGLSLSSIRGLLKLQDRGQPISGEARLRILERLEALDRERCDLVTALEGLEGLNGAPRPTADAARS